MYKFLGQYVFENKTLYETLVVREGYNAIHKCGSKGSAMSSVEPPPLLLKGAVWVPFLL